MADRKSSPPTGDLPMTSVPPPGLDEASRQWIEMKSKSEHEAPLDCGKYQSPRSAPHPGVEQEPLLTPAGEAAPPADTGHDPSVPFSPRKPRTVSLKHKTSVDDPAPVQPGRRVSTKSDSSVPFTPIEPRTVTMKRDSVDYVSGRIPRGKSLDYSALSGGRPLDYFTDPQGKRRGKSLDYTSSQGKFGYHGDDPINISIPEGHEEVPHSKMDDAPDGGNYHELDVERNFVTVRVIRYRWMMSRFWGRHFEMIQAVFYWSLFVLFSAYFCGVLYYSPRQGTVLIVCVCLAVFFSVYGFVRDHYSHVISRVMCEPCGRFIHNTWRYLKWFILLLLLGLLGLFIGLEVSKNPIQCRSLLGIVLIIIFSYLNSTNPAAVKWRPVVLGIGLQVLMGFLVLRWKPGYHAFFWISDKVQALLNYADYGAKFIFGDPNFMMHPIAFKVIPMVVFFSAFTNMMFYLGVMQVVISKVSWLMQHTMHTTTIESLSVAGNIFFTLAEESFILRPYMMRLTRSELHAVMTGGSATAAGFSLAMYIQLGAPAIHVFSAAVMSAPAALAISKLSYPETEESQTKTEEDVELESGTEANVLEAAAAGATMSIKVISYAVAIIIAFYGLLGLVNDLLAYFRGLVGYPEFSFDVICSYVFFPVAFSLGVPVEDCSKVASVLGSKYFGSDLIAYTSMSKYKEAGLFQDRSAMIGTYALLGFSSLSSVGVNIGILGALCPERRNEVSGMALRAILNGNLASLLTASLAGFLCAE